MFIATPPCPLRFLRLNRHIKELARELATWCIVGKTPSRRPFDKMAGILPMSMQFARAVFAGHCWQQKQQHYDCDDVLGSTDHMQNAKQCWQSTLREGILLGSTWSLQAAQSWLFVCYMCRPFQTLINRILPRVSRTVANMCRRLVLPFLCAFNELAYKPCLAKQCSSVSTAWSLILSKRQFSPS